MSLYISFINYVILDAKVKRYILIELIIKCLYTFKFSTTFIKQFFCQLMKTLLFPGFPFIKIKSRLVAFFVYSTLLQTLISHGC